MHNLMDDRIRKYGQLIEHNLKISMNQTTRALKLFLEHQIEEYTIKINEIQNNQTFSTDKFPSGFI